MSYQYLLEKTLRNKTILPKFDRDKIELNFGGCKMQYIPKEFNPYERNYQTRLILKSANDDIQYGDYLIDDFWEVVKLVDKKYYDKHFEYYAIDRAKNIIDYYTQDSDFLYSYQNDGTKFIEISDIGVLTLKNDVVKFTFTDNNISINIKDYSFDSLYNSIELSKQRYILKRVKQIILNHRPLRKGNSLFYNNIEVRKSWYNEYLIASDSENKTLCKIKDKNIIYKFDCLLTSLEDNEIKLMEEEVDKKFKELGW